MLRTLLIGLALLFSCALNAEQAGIALSGTTKDASGTAVAGAKVVVKNAATGQSAETQTDSDGHYVVQLSAAGDYDVSVSASGYSTNTAKVTLVEGMPKTLDMTLGGVLSLGDLGFSSARRKAALRIRPGSTSARTC